jgi:hypothetical protein
VNEFTRYLRTRPTLSGALEECFNGFAENMIDL